MKQMTSDEVREAFLEFFEEMGHQVVPSSALPVYDNPTLLFTNAGMNQFVDTFLGKEERPYKRAVTSQKCMRVQGKHNDLENVGPSPRHHTFFEMLGNFSFGDYFKGGGIRYAYKFLTMVCQIPVERLWYTVHQDDDDAYDIWVKDVRVKPERVLRMGDKTNFWMMGEVGPCGPTSEVHYDWGPEHCTCNESNCSVALDNDCGRWLEIWNLVFMQFDLSEDGSRTPLPKPGVDTGLGLERLTSVVQSQPVTYDTDLFIPTIQRVQELLGDTDEERIEHQTGYRVIADHGRAATFLIADGVLPGNLGRNYVLRMIIRRAARFGRNIGFDEPFLAKIAEVYIGKMGSVYPELQNRREHILHTITLEEERFIRTLDAALTHLAGVLEELRQGGKAEIPGGIAFNLYATHGLPLELTRDVAVERGFSVDERGFQEAKQAHALASGAGAFGKYDTTDNFYGSLLSDLVQQGRLGSSGVDYDPYSGARLASSIVAIIVEDKSLMEADSGDKVEIVTVSTPFYVEAGGEVGDTGFIQTESGAVIRVDDTKQPAQGLIVHGGEVIQGPVKVGMQVELRVNDDRRWDIRRNHTATHILHSELRSALGNQVTQQGSLVAPDRLRFDFSHGQAVGQEALMIIEAAINEAILVNDPVVTEHMGQKDAVKAGAMALFGEKYGDVVRTVKIGDKRSPYSFELCGGLHVNMTGDIGPFRFTSEEAVGAGLRRVEAVTGRQAQELIRERLATLDRLVGLLNTPVDEIEGRIDSLLTDNRFLRKQIGQLRRGKARDEFANLLKDMTEVAGVRLLTAVVDVPDMDGLREMADWFRDKIESGVALLAAVKDGRPIMVAVVTEDLIARGIRAGDIVRNAARIVGGGGGGRPAMAQAGGKDAGKLPEALDSVSEHISMLLGQ